MRHLNRSLATLAVALEASLGVVGVRAAQAQPIAGSAALKARAKISGDSARKIARAQVPNGKIQSGELEDEHGKLIYSFDLTVAGTAGVEEVNVDALTGAIVAHEHESPKAEKAEARAARAEKKAATRKP